MHNEYFQINGESDIAHLQLNRPELLDAMGPSFFTGLRDAVLALDNAVDPRALLTRCPTFAIRFSWQGQQ
ncbi:hypothetical protein CR51_18105 [Caballeronia megalochromosomata]|nr:hypothetical protein CR51_18105 [Caballeronia megalochromosomata]